MKINMDDVAVFHEILGSYDGWSVAQMKDGTYINRWEPEDGRRYEVAEKYIDSLKGEASSA